MSEEKQIEEMDCKKCLHYEMCLENFREAKKEGFWEFTDEEKYFSHAGECDFYAAGYRKQSEGEWIVKGECWKTLQCSSCGHTTDTIYDNSPFCPNCGAKMKGA